MLAWLPRVDGVFMKEQLQISALLGCVANVPMITGVFPFLHSRGTHLVSRNCDDEVTLVSFSSPKVT